MKLFNLLYAMTIGTLFVSVECSAQGQMSQDDSTVNAIKINNLKTRKTALQKQIAAEDKKRNVVIEGVSPETLEKKNERQDSICLELRSELIDVELELKELGADNTTVQVAQQYNNLIHVNHQDSAQVTIPNEPNVPAKPTKPSKPSKPATPIKKK